MYVNGVGGSSTCRIHARSAVVTCMLIIYLHKALAQLHRSRLLLPHMHIVNADVFACDGDLDSTGASRVGCKLLRH